MQFAHGTKITRVPSMVQVGLSCRTDDNPRGNADGKEQGRQFIHGRPYLLGGRRSQSGFRKGAERAIFMSAPLLLRDRVKAL
eukprot:2848862-Pyramimonas_sp.AAC.1